MAKFHSIDDVKPHCEELIQAYQRALRRAFDKSIHPGHEIEYDAGHYGNAVSTKGTLTGTDKCGECGKNIDLTLTLEKIQATNLERQPVKLFNTLGGTETIKLSGPRCGKESLE